MKQSVTLLLLVLLLIGCDNSKRFYKAVAKNPALLPTACQQTYPCLPVEIKSDTVIVYDTLAAEIQVQTQVVKDTVRVEKIIRELVTKTVKITDTIRIIHRAALVNAERERARVTDLMMEYKEQADSYQQQRDKWKRLARQRLYWIIGLSAIMGLGVMWKLKTFIPIK